MRSSYFNVSKTAVSGAIAFSLLSFQASADPEKAGRHLPNAAAAGIQAPAVPTM